MRRIKAPIALSVRIDALILIGARNIFMASESGTRGGLNQYLTYRELRVASLINGPRGSRFHG